MISHLVAGETHSAGRTARILVLVFMINCRVVKCRDVSSVSLAWRGSTGDVVQKMIDCESRVVETRNPTELGKDCRLVNRLQVIQYSHQHEPRHASENSIENDTT